MPIDIHGNYIVRTVARSRHNGTLYVSSDLWHNGIDALAERGEYFRPVYRDDQREILAAYFGGLMPQYPGEWSDIRDVDPAGRPPAIPLYSS